MLQLLVVMEAILYLAPSLLLAVAVAVGQHHKLAQTAALAGAAKPLPEEVVTPHQ
jgi:hypothetical protein